MGVRAHPRTPRPKHGAMCMRNKDCLRRGGHPGHCLRRHKMCMQKKQNAWGTRDLSNPCLRNKDCLRRGGHPGHCRRPWKDLPPVQFTNYGMLIDMPHPNHVKRRIPLICARSFVTCDKCPRKWRHRGRCLTKIK